MQYYRTGIECPGIIRSTGQFPAESFTGGVGENIAAADQDMLILFTAYEYMGKHGLKHMFECAMMFSWGNGDWNGMIKK